jgi:uncharacterized protein (TIGR03083 family)
MERKRVELRPALDCLERAVPRLMSLLRNIPDPGARAVGTWSAGDVASHVASVFGNYVDMIDGDEPVLAETTGDIERINSMWLERDRGRDPQAASSRIEDAFDRMMKRARAASDDWPIAWHSGLTLPISTVVCLALGEVLVHGHDIGSASGSKWAIPVDEARTVLDGIIELAPLYVDEHGARGFSARYELRIRGGLQAELIFEDGLLTLDRPAGHAECKISADPVAFLLVSYGRIAVWGPMMRGKLIAWGRKPWLGLKLTSLLRNP